MVDIINHLDIVDLYQLSIECIMATQSLNEALHQLLHVYKRQLRAGVIRHQIPLSITHIRMLKGICRIPDSTAGTFVQRMGQDKARVTRIINELMNDALVEKRDNPHDRRSQFLVPTDAGLKMLGRIEALEEEAAVQMTGQLSAEDIEAFMRITATMTQNAADTADKEKDDHE